MPLPPPHPRTHLHTRNVVFRGFRRHDQLWDIEAEMIDIKTEAFSIPGEGAWSAGEPLHEMSIRVTIDDELVIRDIAVTMDGYPFPECPQAQTPMQSMIGCRMGAGWRHAIEKNLGGIRGCAHLRELLFNMATVAFQTVSHETPHDSIDQPPHQMGKCLAWDFNGAVVRRHHPEFSGWEPKTRASEAVPSRPNKP